MSGFNKSLSDPTYSSSPPIDIKVRIDSDDSSNADGGRFIQKTPPAHYYTGSMAPAKLPTASTTKQLMQKRAALTASASR